MPDLTGIPEAIDPLLEPFIDATASTLTLSRWAPAWHTGHWIERHRLPCIAVLRVGLVALGWASA